jgi:acyl-CoA oxidase
MDNGYARFTNLRIPREDMLMGFAQVSPDGQYTKQEGAEKVAYGIMLDVRARICIHSAYVLARALTISIRYSLVREQGFLDSRALYPAEERSVMEYPTQQRVLMPLLALTYALHFTGQSVKALYTQYTKTHDLSVLSDLHATSAGLKAYMTTHVSEGVLACCKMCGGHGYLVSAGFTDLYTSYLPFCTLEGTREVLLQQTGRFLLKQRQLALSGRSSSQSQMSQTAAYLRGRVSNRPQQLKPVSMDGLKNYLRVVSQKQTITAAAFRDVALVILNLFRQRVALLVDAAALTVYQHSQRLGPNSSITDQLLAASVELCRAAEAHCELLILEAFYKRIVLLTAADPPSSNAGVILPDLSPEIKSFREMFVLLAMTIMERHVGQFLLTGLLAPGDVQLISTAEFVLCSSLRVDSLNLIEGWLLSDKRIWSTLGRSDGNVYEALYEATKKEPLNETTVSDGYNLYLKHVIQKPYPDGSNGNIGAAKIVSRL